MNRKACARCGKQLPADKPRLYSHFTRHYYCADIAGCARRAKRATKRELSVA